MSDLASEGWRSHVRLIAVAASEKLVLVESHSISTKRKYKQEAYSWFSVRPPNTNDISLTDETSPILQNLIMSI